MLRKSSAQYKYFAIRVENSIAIRRTMKGLQRFKSTIYRKDKTIMLSQISYSGGIIVGTIPYAQWHYRGYPRIEENGYVKITREQYLAIRPFVLRGS